MWKKLVFYEMVKLDSEKQNIYQNIKNMIKHGNIIKTCSKNSQKPLDWSGPTGSGLN